MDATSNLLVSVIIPVFNGSNYLAQAIESVLAQSYPYIELIIVDDGSQDDTWKIIQSYQSRVCGIHQHNHGVASALNTGIQCSHGEFIAWLSHDDVFLPGKIERQVQFLRDNPHYGGCYTDFEIIDAQGNHRAVVRAGWCPAVELAGRFLQDMHINGSTTLIRKEWFVKAGGFNETLAHTQDMDMWLRISEWTELGYLPEVLLKFRSHPVQGSLKFEVQLEGEQRYFQDLFTRYGPIHFFPELGKVNDPTRQLALGSRMFADRLIRYRHWYLFGLKYYQRSYKTHPSFGAWLRLTQTWIILKIIGNEQDSLYLIRRARISLAYGQKLQSRQLALTMLRKHPLRIDALVIWVATLIPSGIWNLLKCIKQKV